ncbi:flagellar hook-length control protein [Pseudoduganella sp. LjRoot289]|uniref:protein YgfX n=1 Tax=Pseudoduganella sp. LjRoot289 TaxID=3342314 RepID=UPI003ECE3620
MSIAVTAVVRPSLCLRLLQAGFAVSALAVSTQLPFILEFPCILASFWALFSLLRGAKTHRLDISGIGQIRLAVYLEAETESVEILAGSTCWPWLLLLRLRRERGTVAVLAVLPDSVAPGVFRPLALACRACTAKKL